MFKSKWFLVTNTPNINFVVVGDKKGIKYESSRWFLKPNTFICFCLCFSVLKVHSKISENVQKQDEK